MATGPRSIGGRQFRQGLLCFARHTGQSRGRVDSLIPCVFPAAVCRGAADGSRGKARQAGDTDRWTREAPSVLPSNLANAAAPRSRGRRHSNVWQPTCGELGLGGMKPGRQPAHWFGSSPCRPGKPCGRAFPVGPVMDPRSFPASQGEPVFRVGVTPSAACGLGQAPSSAKGWVLAMLARKGELRRGSGPARERAFLSGRLCPAKETAPEGADAGTTPAGPPGQREGLRP